MRLDDDEMSAALLLMGSHEQRVDGLVQLSRWIVGDVDDLISVVGRQILNNDRRQARNGRNYSTEIQPELRVCFGVE